MTTNILDVPPAADASDDLSWMPAWQMRDRIAAGTLSPVDVIEHVLARIAALEPRLNAFRTILADEARAQAKEAEAAVRRGDALGPLHGVPIAVKESLQIKGVPYFAFTSTDLWCGPATHDQVLVERLRAAGAIIIGTTVLPGMGLDPKTTTIDQHVRNPWDLGRVPGGSTAGGAAAVAAGIIPVTIGSDGGGSSRLPAALTGIAGIHPRPGRIPWFDFDRPGSNKHYSCGPMARDARDIAITLQAIAGPDGRDFFALQESAPDYLEELDSGVEGLRFAWTDDFGFGNIYAFEETPEIIHIVREAAEAFKQLGASVTPTEEQWEDFWPNLLAEVSAYGDEQQIAGYSASHTPDSLRAAQESHGRNFDRFVKVFRDHDLMLSPTIQFVAPEVEWWVDIWKDPSKLPHGSGMPLLCAHTNIFNVLGWPAMSVPCGYLRGLPVGLQIIGRPDQEALVLRAGQAFMRAFPRNERPQATA